MVYSYSGKVTICDHHFLGANTYLLFTFSLINTFNHFFDKCFPYCCWTKACWYTKGMYEPGCW